MPDADDFVAVAQRADRDGANRGIESGDVAAPRKNADSAFAHEPENTRIGVVLKDQGERMAINFRQDVDQVLKEAKTQQKPVLLDFNAAPM